MRLLAIDTATDHLCLALAQGKTLETLKVIEERVSQKGRQHGIYLVPEVADLLSDHHLEAQDIDALVVGLGPGSYTGLRIGLTLAKIWGKTQEIPVYPLSTLAGLAVGTPADLLKEDSLLLPLLDARRGTAYLGLYRWQEDRLDTLIQDQHAQWEDFIQELPDLIEATSSQRIVLIGSGLQTFAETLSSDHLGLCELRILEDPCPHLGPALEKGVFQKPLQDIEDLLPNYAHATLAERQWAQSQGEDLADYQDHEAFIDHYK